ncbi:hypothetical protein [Aestuariibius sp. HNIBRBA575]|uniref:hypothetical protein n=1 Tax=Aestuariibius sp. HNIBRBA575 TaxID=3233343 RepID=UPI0034A275CB
MKKIVFLISMVALASCGADGAPFEPTANAGISIGTGGISTNCSVGTSNGTVSVNVGC